MNEILTQEKSIYLQIAEMIETDILRDILLEEERVPSTNELAKLYAINPATAAKGVNILVDEGILYKKRGIGMFVAEALSFVDSRGLPLDAVAVSCGPGSYTGLRIGVSMAKGVCYGRNLPLIGLHTLEVLCVPVLLYHDLPEDALLCPMIDARRMEVYAAVYDRALEVKREIAADIVDENSYLEFLDEHPVYFFGNGAAKCREKITHPNAHFIDEICPLAKWMFPLAEKAIVKQDFKDVAYFEPFNFTT